MPLDPNNIMKLHGILTSFAASSFAFFLLSCGSVMHSALLIFASTPTDFIDFSFEKTTDLRFGKKCIFLKSWNTIRQFFLKILKSHRKNVFLVCSETFKNEVFGWTFFGKFFIVGKFCERARLNSNDVGTVT